MALCKCTKLFEFAKDTHLTNLLVKIMAFNPPKQGI